MKIGYLGAGAWGTCLASLLAENGHLVIMWAIPESFASQLISTREHPKFPGKKLHDNIQIVKTAQEACNGADMIVESVTSKGIRPTFEKVLATKKGDRPFVVTSKGIEQGTGLLIPEIIQQMGGSKALEELVCLSGPTLADEIMKKQPATMVAASLNPGYKKMVAEAFSGPLMRVYLSSDPFGVCWGGAAKNVLAIASGICAGLGYGDNARAALLVRGWKELCRIASVKHCDEKTLHGLSGLGDMIATCHSSQSRNFRFGLAIAKGQSQTEAQKSIGMVVEGAYSCISILELAQKNNMSCPILESIHRIIYHNADPAVLALELLSRGIKEE